VVDLDFRRGVSLLTERVPATVPGDRDYAAVPVDGLACMVTAALDGLCRGWNRPWSVEPDWVRVLEFAESRSTNED